MKNNKACQEIYTYYLSSSLYFLCVFNRLKRRILGMDGVKRKRSGKSNRLRKIAIVDRKRGHRSRRKKGSWSDLPQDIPILERLHLVDRIRFRAVCKNWLLAPVHYIQPDKLPWIMNYWFSIDPTICSLSEPSRKLPYILKDEMELAVSCNCLCFQIWLGPFGQKGL